MGNTEEETVITTKDLIATFIEWGRQFRMSPQLFNKLRSLLYITSHDPAGSPKFGEEALKHFLRILKTQVAISQEEVDFRIQGLCMHTHVHHVQDAKSYVHTCIACAKEWIEPIEKSPAQTHTNTSDFNAVPISSYSEAAGLEECKHENFNEVTNHTTSTEYEFRCSDCDHTWTSPFIINTSARDVGFEGVDVGREARELELMRRCSHPTFSSEPTKHAECQGDTKYFDHKCDVCGSEWIDVFNNTVNNAEKSRLANLGEHIDLTDIYVKPGDCKHLRQRNYSYGLGEERAGTHHQCFCFDCLKLWEEPNSAELSKAEEPEICEHTDYVSIHSMGLVDDDVVGFKCLKCGGCWYEPKEASTLLYMACPHPENKCISSWVDDVEIRKCNQCGFSWLPISLRRKNSKLDVDEAAKAIDQTIKLMGGADLAEQSKLIDKQEAIRTMRQVKDAKKQNAQEEDKPCEHPLDKCVTDDDGHTVCLKCGYTVEWGK